VKSFVTFAKSILTKYDNKKPRSLSPGNAQHAHVRTLPCKSCRER